MFDDDEDYDQNKDYRPKIEVDQLIDRSEEHFLHFKHKNIKAKFESKIERFKLHFEEFLKDNKVEDIS